MTEVTTIGIDIAKSVFHIHCVDGSGETVIRARVNAVPIVDHDGITGTVYLIA